MGYGRKPCRAGLRWSLDAKCAALFGMPSRGRRPERVAFWRKFQAFPEGPLRLVHLDRSMTWIIISIPLMLLAIAIAVLPVLLTTIWESRGQRAGVAVSSTERKPAPANPFGPQRTALTGARPGRH